MVKNSEFVNYIVELLEPFEDISIKSMFGGYGIFKKDIMFALVSNDILYFKVDEFNKFEFDRLHLEPFIYMKAKKPTPMSYHRAPEEVFDNSEDMLRWARFAFEAALRAKKKKEKVKLRTLQLF